MKSSAILAAVVFLILGCETGNDRRSAATEVLLAGAGFKIRVADTPERQNQLEAMTQRQIVRHDHDGEAVYVFANARLCDCLYAGTEADYQRYRDLARSSRATSVQRLEAVPAGPGSEVDWSLWMDSGPPSQSP